ncbi:hypothetical protein Mgra_00006620 [Meloidogyne graminicola]|uniref:adenylate cyclase n=2 Tax=Chromadorea TaxID=119089 RepID=A0A8S9ZKT2_9BILA|nr:hypothetical protein Mgra_00006620 [Meloidogyne graminicola]
MSEIKISSKKDTSTKSNKNKLLKQQNLNEEIHSSSPVEPIETDAMLEKCEENRLANAIISASKGEHEEINTFLPQQFQANGSSGVELLKWNPQFASPTLETQYWKCSFPLLRDRFRSGLLYILICCLSWLLFLWIFNQTKLYHWLIASLLSLLFGLMFWFASCSPHYQRFYLPTSFLCTFLLCLTTLFICSSAETFMGPIASMATSMQVILLVYAVIPFPLYLCIISCGFYSFFFELLAAPSPATSTVFLKFASSVIHFRTGTKTAIHLCVHLLGIHLYILTQVRQRKTFLKVGQSLLARKDLELETQFKDHMIQSVMPKKVADELLKETSELRRPSASLESHSNCRTSNATVGRSSAAGESTTGGGGIIGPNGRLSSGAKSVRKFRPFTMNLMNDVSILFADIAGFTKMASNKSADELVNLLNDLFGRFDYLCGRCCLEKISTLGDCYYCVAGCPEPREDHAKCCVEMGLAMIIAIRQFDLDRGQSVNMRVGIHTGKVMCGMVGTRRFKFDVFSNDVNFANEMESTGVAGRVHISEKTADYLDDNYILEEGTPYKGMKTFFIAGRSKEFESASGQFLNTISGDSDSVRVVDGGGGIASLESGNGIYKASFRKVRKIHKNTKYKEICILYKENQNYINRHSVFSETQNYFNFIFLQKLKLVDKLRTIQTNSLPPVSRACTTTTTTTSQQLIENNTIQFNAFGGGGSLRMRLLDRSFDNTTQQQLLNNKEIIKDKFITNNTTGSAQVLTSIGEFCTDENIKHQKIHKQQQIHNRLVDDTRKSTSLQMLTHSDGILPPSNTPSSKVVSSVVDTPTFVKTSESDLLDNNKKEKNDEQTSLNKLTDKTNKNNGNYVDWRTAERIGGKISADLANESSNNNSGRGSRSSGLQEIGSEMGGHSTTSLAGLDTAISHHHNAASLTRFDTDHRDFDQRLAQVIHGADGSFAKGFWMHQESLNRWTLNFNQRDIENEYRAHFAAGDSSDKYSTTRNVTAGIEKHRQLSTQLQNLGGGVHSVTATLSQQPSNIHPKNTNNKNTTKNSLIISPRHHRPRYRYSGVFIDIFVSAFAFVVCAILFLVQPGIELSPSFLIYISMAAIFLTAVIILVGLPLLNRRPILPWLHQWGPRHVLGALLIALPVGVALFNMPFCLNKIIYYYSSPNLPLICIHPGQLVIRLLYSYIFLLALFTHCNFRCLAKNWTSYCCCINIFIKFCQHQLDYIRSLGQDSTSLSPFHSLIEASSSSSNSSSSSFFHDSIQPPPLPCNNSQQPSWSSGTFGTPLFLWELVLDVILAVVLVAFLNYQFEAAFRMSFYGDIQARRDTAKMQLVRDQADWLLNNIIPPHAVESLKTNTKYSENHKLTAVMFASITNWHEMYEETYEGGREFIRVLNEVIGDFDELLDRSEFAHVEKIKTIGPCYMAASDLLNFEFECKIGLNIGPVTAGVIGTTKLYYDIWGDTVNIASRMYQNGVKNRIQVSSHTKNLLIDRYDFEHRDHIQVKGVDGGMDTFLLIGRKGEGPLTFPFIYLIKSNNLLNKLEQYENFFEF